MKYPIHNGDKKHKIPAIRQIANTMEAAPIHFIGSYKMNKCGTEVNHVPGCKTQYYKPINSSKINLQIQYRLQQNPQLIFANLPSWLSNLSGKSKRAKAKTILKKINEKGFDLLDYKTETLAIFKKCGIRTGINKKINGSRR